MKLYIFLFFIVFNFSLADEVQINTNATVPTKKEQVLDFSAGVIEGELNRPSMLMELGSNYKDFNDLILLRDDFNSFHDSDSVIRFKYVDENL